MLAVGEQSMVLQVVHHVVRDDMFEALACNGSQGDSVVIGWSYFSSFLKIGETSADFHCVGTCPSSIDFWNKLVQRAASSGPTSLRNMGLILYDMRNINGGPGTMGIPEPGHQQVGPLCCKKVLSTVHVERWLGYSDVDCLLHTPFKLHAFHSEDVNTF